MNTVKFSGVGYDGKGQLRATQKGTPVINFSVSDKIIHQSGKSYTSWFDCTAWGELANKIAGMEPCMLDIEAEAKLDCFEVNGEKRRKVRFTVREVNQAMETPENCQTSHTRGINANQEENSAMYQQPYCNDDIPF